MKTARMISLGCPRNLVDSEIIAGSLKKAGIRIIDSGDSVDICIINTCAFTAPAREESVDRIMEAARLKREGRIGFLVVSGCLPQMYGRALSKELREADLFIGTNDFFKLGEILSNIKKFPQRTNIQKTVKYIYNEKDPRITLTPSHYAYIKISEGCSNCCSYCVIPRLRGKFRSRPIESIEAEFVDLASRGKLKEVNIIGQDTTLYGADIYGKIMFSDLLRRICRIRSSVRWIRILYTHPAHYSDAFIDTMRDEDRICKYLDIPIQHISDKILKRMNRHTTSKSIKYIIDKLRDRVRGISLRTSLIVGFPGETDRDFRMLLDFVRKTRFERLGAFLYSKEAGTKAARFLKQVPEKVKQARFDELMKLQQGISYEINRSLVGKTLDVLIDTNNEQRKTKNDFSGRTQADAPEIDGVVYVSGEAISTGSFCRAKITGWTEYDLIGKKVR